MFHENYKNKALPLVRVPPKMPSTARRSGHVSVIFDVDTQGKPINIRLVNSTEKKFEKPSLESVEKWRYQRLDDAPKDQLRKDVAAKISFKLTNSRGQLIPEKS